MHGGRVQAHSRGDQHGSRFVVTCPRRILIVDDNVDSADSLCLLLAAYGHQVTKAYDGRGGLAAAQQSPPDLAILDLGLPDIDGFELALRLHAGGATAHTVLVALSGWGQEVDRQRSAAAGFAHHLIKPADPDVVLELIRGSAGPD